MGHAAGTGRTVCSGKCSGLMTAVWRNHLLGQRTGAGTGHPKTYDGTDGTRNCFEEDVRVATGVACRPTVLNNCVMGQNGTDGTASCLGYRLTLILRVPGIMNLILIP